MADAVGINMKKNTVQADDKTFRYVGINSLMI